MLAFRLARRELRGGVRGLWIVLLCLALGVAVIAAVGTLRAATDRGLAEDGRRILGGDLEVESGSQPLPDALRDWLRARGAALSDVVQMRSMLVAPSGERQLVELKAVDAAWPLVGEARSRMSRTAPSPQPPPARGGGVGAAPYSPSPRGRGSGGGGRARAASPPALSNHGLLAERVVLDRLGLHPGDTVRLGNASFTVRGALISEPDRVAAPLILGPRVLIAADALPSTGLIAPGSMVQYAHPRHAARPAPAAACRAARDFPDQGWRIRDPRDAAPGRHPLHRPDQPVPDAGRPDLAAGRRHRRRQRRARLAGRARAHHRHAALPRRVLRPGVRGLPDPGPGARRSAASSSGLSVGAAGADRAGRLAQGRAAGAAGARPLSRPARCSPRPTAC